MEDPFKLCLTCGHKLKDHFGENSKCLCTKKIGVALFECTCEGFRG